MPQGQALAAGLARCWDVILCSAEGTVTDLLTPALCSHFPHRGPCSLGLTAQPSLPLTACTFHQQCAPRCPRGACVGSYSLLQGPRWDGTTPMHSASSLWNACPRAGGQAGIQAEAWHGRSLSTTTIDVTPTLPLLSVFHQPSQLSTLPQKWGASPLPLWHLLWNSVVLPSSSPILICKPLTGFQSSNQPDPPRTRTPSFYSPLLKHCQWPSAVSNQAP